jgi:hypothetical protein
LAKSRKTPLRITQYFKQEPKTILLYAKDIPFELIITNEIHNIVSMIPGDSIQTIEKISSEYRYFNLDKIIRCFMSIRSLATHKIFFIRSIKTTYFEDPVPKTSYNVIIEIQAENPKCRAYFAENNFDSDQFLAEAEKFIKEEEEALYAWNGRLAEQKKQALRTKYADAGIFVVSPSPQNNLYFDVKAVDDFEGAEYVKLLRKIKEGLPAQLEGSLLPLSLRKDKEPEVKAAGPQGVALAPIELELKKEEEKKSAKPIPELSPVERFFVALTQKKFDNAKNIIDQIDDVNVKIDNGIPLVKCAIDEGPWAEDVIRKLIIDRNATVKEVAVDYAIKNGQTLRTVELLIAKGAPVDQAACLAESIKKKNITLTKFFIEKFPRSIYSIYKGDTPLGYAVKFKATEIVALLIFQNHVIVGIGDLYDAITLPPPPVPEIVECLISGSKHQFLTSTINEHSLLWHAQQTKNLEIIEKLRFAGFELTAEEKDVATP